MSPFNNNRRLDNSNGIDQDIPNEAMNAKKTPWFLRFAPEAILRNGLIAVLAIAAVLTTSIEQADAASRKKRPPETNPPRSGVGDSIAGNFIYDAITGQRVAVTSAMSGTITAVPRVEQVESYRLYHTINGYAHSGLRPDVSDPDKDMDWDANHKWTEYHDVHYGRVVNNPDYDPEAYPGEPNSNKYHLRTHAEYRRYGSFFRSASNMNRIFASARLGYVYDDDGNKYTEYTKRGTWVYYGKSEKIKCEHELVDTIVNTDGRLALGQEYHYGLKYRRVWLTYVPDEGFVVKKTERLKNLNSAIPGWKFSATSESRRKLNFLREKNMEIVEGPTALGQSRIYWESRVEDGLFSAPRTIWERAQYDKLKGKEKENN